MSAVEWETFAQGLAEELTVLPAGALVVISEPGEGSRPHDRYAQFAQETDRLTAELVGNSYVLEDKRASEEGERAIAAAGWRPGPADHPNWQAELAWPASSRQYQALAEMVVTGLRDGYGIADLGEFRYQAWNEKSGEDIELPRLGLPRVM